MKSLDVLVRQLISLWESRADEIEAAGDHAAAKLAAIRTVEAMKHMAFIMRPIVTNKAELAAFERLMADLAAINDRLCDIRDALAREAQPP